MRIHENHHELPKNTKTGSKLPKGISAKVVKNVIHITGSNKEIVGQVAAKIRSYRPPEPYKGKGIKYTTERIIRKAGKTGGK